MKKINIGDEVLVGLKTKGGAGFKGIVTKIQGNNVIVKNHEGRTIKGLLSNSTLINKKQHVDTHNYFTEQIISEGLGDWKVIWKDMKQSAKKLAPKVGSMLNDVDTSLLKKYEPVAKKVVGTSNVGSKINLQKEGVEILDEKFSLSSTKNAIMAIGISSGLGALTGELDALLYKLDSNITSKLYDLTKFELFKLDSVTTMAKSAQSEWWVKPMIAVFLVCLVSYGILYAIGKLQKEEIMRENRQYYLSEKAKSEIQQQAAGAALAAKRGEIPVSDLNGASLRMYNSMTEKQLRDFAATKHDPIPHKVEEDNSAYGPTLNTENDKLKEDGWNSIREHFQYIAKITDKFPQK